MTLTVDRLKEVLAYNSETGEFLWLVSKGPISAGRVAGKTDGHGYRRIKIDGRSYAAHRLAWLYVYGAWPGKFLDHKNTNKADNRISNLREALNCENMWNRGPAKHNTSGFKGVDWHKQRGKWRAKIRVKGKEVHLGLFDCPKEAHAAYVAASDDLHGVFSRAA